jgi:hypothetical protein
MRSCAMTTLITGAEAAEYADQHLVVHHRRDSTEWFGGKPFQHDAPWVAGWRGSLRGTGFGECQCPATGWRWAESWTRDPDDRKLRRRTWTTPHDYVEPDLIAARAAEVHAAQRLVDITFMARDDSAERIQHWKDATDRLKLAPGDTVFTGPRRPCVSHPRAVTH